MSRQGPNDDEPKCAICGTHYRHFLNSDCVACLARPWPRGQSRDDLIARTVRAAVRIELRDRGISGALGAEAPPAAVSIAHRVVVALTVAADEAVADEGLEGFRDVNAPLGLALAMARDIVSGTGEGWTYSEHVLARGLLESVSTESQRIASVKPGTTA